MPFLRPFDKDYVQVDANNERQWDAAKVKVQLLKSLPNAAFLAFWIIVVYIP